MEQLRIEAGTETSEMVSYIFREMDDALVDQVQLVRETAPVEGIASEPVTLAATMVFATVAAPVIGRIVERYLAGRQHEKDLAALKSIILRSDTKSSDAIRALQKISKAHAGVEVHLGPLPKVSVDASLKTG